MFGAEAAEPEPDSPISSGADDGAGLQRHQRPAAERRPRAGDQHQADPGQHREERRGPPPGDLLDQRDLPPRRRAGCGWPSSRPAPGSGRRRCPTSRAATGGSRCRQPAERPRPVGGATSPRRAAPARRPRHRGRTIQIERAGRRSGPTPRPRRRRPRKSGALARCPGRSRAARRRAEDDTPDTTLSDRGHDEVEARSPRRSSGRACRTPGPCRMPSLEPELAAERRPRWP